MNKKTLCFEILQKNLLAAQDVVLPSSIPKLFSYSKLIQGMVCLTCIYGSYTTYIISMLEEGNFLTCENNLDFLVIRTLKLKAIDDSSNTI